MIVPYQLDILIMGYHTNPTIFVRLWGIRTIPILLVRFPKFGGWGETRMWLIYIAPDCNRATGFIEQNSNA